MKWNEAVRANWFRERTLALISDLSCVRVCLPLVLGLPFSLLAGGQTLPCAALAATVFGRRGHHGRPVLRLTQYATCVAASAAGGQPRRSAFSPQAPWRLVSGGRPACAADRGT